MTTPPPTDLVEVEVAPGQVRAGDLVVSADDEATGPAEPARTDGFVPVPMRAGGYALLRGDRLTTVRRRPPVVEPPPIDPAPAPDLTEQLAEVRDLALALADTAKPGSTAKLAADKVRDRIKATGR